MNLHHKIQPHHHLAIWAISALAVVAAAAIYSNAAITTTLATEPSEETKQFFGFDEDGDHEHEEFTTPPECDYKEEAEKINQLSDEIQALYNDLNTLQSQDTSQMSEDELLAHQQKINDLQDKIEAKIAESDKLSASFSSGPSNECKKALVAQSLKVMEKMQPEMRSKFLATLTKVETAVAKVESVIPDLEEAGVEKAKIDKVKQHVNTIKLQVATLRSFFLKMSQVMTNWIATAKSDPLKAFDLMQQGSMFNEGEASKAAAAADTMVANFKELIKIFDEIVAEDEGGQ